MARCFKIPITLVGIVLWVALVSLYNYQLVGSDTPGCRPVRMGPSYARILGFDLSYTQYASKYSLYLYREQGKDLRPKASNNYRLDGTPVLFIPGNAGSYRQVRSIASKTSNIIADKQYDGFNSKHGKLDFFTADFNEDFTAFHGRTMLDQAEYLNEAIKFILSLYSQDEVPPKSVIIIGHSMGGIVARVLPTLPNYQEDSIKVMITLSSPHSKSPLTFDRDIMKVYRAVNEFWHEAYYGNSELSDVASARLRDVSILSITGGSSDMTLPADYTTMKGLVPDSNGFTVFSTGIPGVWTPIDHLAIVWCDQLRTVLSNALLDIMDVGSSEKVVGLDERMQLLKNRFLAGFEKADSDEVLSSVTLKLDKANVHQQASKSVIKTSVSVSSVFKIGANETFSLLSLEKPLDSCVYLCSDSIRPETIHDMTDESTSEFVSFSCHDYSSMVNMIPKSNDVESIKDSSIRDKTSPYYGLRLDPDVVNEYSHLVVTGLDSLVELKESPLVEVRPGWLGSSFKVPSGLRTTVRLKGVRSSLMSYDVSYKKLDFNPIIRQFINEETKWHIDNEFNLNFHGQAPYLPPVGEDLQLEVWTGHVGDQTPLTVHIKPNFLVRLKLLIIRYRITILSYGLIVNLLVFAFQLKEYEKTNKFPTYQKTLDKLLTSECLRDLVCILSVLIRSADVSSIVRKIIAFVHLEVTEVNGLGVSGSFFLHLMFLTLSVCINVLINLLVTSFLKSGGLIKLPKPNLKVKNIVLALMVLLTIVYLPYQVIYVVLTVTQLLKTLGLKNNNEINYNVIMFMMMIWILPINVPIIVVLVHNLTVNWKTSFSSHHNILSIVPIIYLVNYKNIIRLKYTNVIIVYLAYFMSYCFFYGSINTFWLYQLFNYMCILLIVVDNEWIHRDIK
ncbi:GPI inositol deacylase [Yamadazyma tenuis]|uniref:GPI inositol-deacylase n=1 Tax=Candida tenuis (strain ATCC 10573 / BCRC 21748 / CBS 615 / JCM 9827 / NBRC 10315 / NRRL Y-1498 / VKM Y-70) TaxID=590646 RepID=G3BFB8_CANTC|nr:PGAP1-domain-containing protein [Yamadazyma tenuis ATCC 10573]EGV60019.1 PGAP1-domain-containing protein [Yamadazyma tenuis ATCC 10573]WEJ94752.1 GPI inositol deacylase [Yamadazyma tenuis]